MNRRNKIGILTVFALVVTAVLTGVAYADMGNPIAPLDSMIKYFPVTLTAIYGIAWMSSFIQLDNYYPRKVGDSDEGQETSWKRKKLFEKYEREKWKCTLFGLKAFLCAGASFWFCNTSSALSKYTQVFGVVVLIVGYMFAIVADYTYREGNREKAEKQVKIQRIVHCAIILAGMLLLLTRL
ncbi:MAG: hypothetical protein IKX54_05480 [Lachnospiraceae bacterium]|nr:hypothetical protein [Lachnospiraceae bacterium]